MKKNEIKITYLLIVLFTVLLSLFATTYAADAAISGKGTQGKPYILNFDYATQSQNGANKYIEIPYKKDANFWFQIHENSEAGTYAVEYDKGAKKVKITYVSNNTRIYYPYEHQEDAKYVQAGVIPEINNSTIEPEKKDITFTIETREETIGPLLNKAYFWNYIVNKTGGSSTPHQYTLKNTFVPGGNLYVQHPSYFVFVPTNGTVEKLYKSSSEAACKNSAYTNNIRYHSGYAEYIIDSRVPVWATLNKNLDYPTKVVRFGNWNGSSITDQDEHRLNIKYHFIAKDIEPEEQAGVIEFAITKILLGIGDVFIAITKAFLGDDITMDSIIFNKYESTVIDFRGKVGFLANTEVRKIINYMYAGFEKIAIVINIVILLYLGIQVVFNIGSEKQSKYFKNLQNWVVGIIILFIGPRFFPILTDVSNTIVGYIGTAITPYVTQYNIAAMLDDDALLGEDAETVDLETQIEQGIKSKTAQQKKMEEEIEAYERQSEEQYENMKKFHDKQQDYIDTLEASGKYTTEYIEERRKNANFLSYIDEINNYVKTNRANWNATNENELNTLIEKFDNRWGIYGSITFYRTQCNRDECRALVWGNEIYKADGSYDEVHSPICETTRIYPVTEAKRFMEEYKELQLKCGELESQIASLQAYQNSKDLMGEMRVRAGQTGRVVYAIIWFILFFQLISLLALYYKRLIMIAILIMLFPVVMITYAIDKIGDGAAQTFETWTKEFTVNIIVQIAHAIVYVTLIQTGLSFYEANPNNWLFCIIAVLCLFPLERLLRSMFGINGNTIGNLNANVIGGALVAAGAIRAGVKGVKGAKNLAKDIKKNGVAGTIQKKANNVKKKIQNSWKNFNEAEDEKNAAKDQKAKKRQSVADRKYRTRNTNIQRRQQQMQNAGAVKKAWLKTVNAASMVRNGMYHGANIGRKVKGISRTKFAKNAGKAFKLAGISARKIGGLTAGVISGSTNTIMAAAKGSGMINSITQGATVGGKVNNLIAGPKKKPQQKKPAPPQTTALPSTKNSSNMPGGQTAKNAPTPIKNRVSNSSTNAGRSGRKQIKGTKKAVKTRRITYTQTNNNNNNGNNSGNNTNP